MGILLYSSIGFVIGTIVYGFIRVFIYDESDDESDLFAHGVLSTIGGMVWPITLIVSGLTLGVIIGAIILSKYFNWIGRSIDRLKYFFKYSFRNDR